MAPDLIIDDGPCTFVHDGHEYTSGGAFLARCTDGLIRGVAYVVGTRETGYRLQTWHGEDLGPAFLGTRYRGNFGDERQSVTVACRGTALYGTLCGDTQLVRLTEYKHPPAWLKVPK